MRPRTRLYRFAKAFVFLGQISARWPGRALVVLLALSALMAIGLAGLSTDDALDEFLQSRTPDYQAFERLSERFPSSDLDVYVTVDGRELFSREHLQQMQELNFALLLSEAVESVVSVFSLREPLRAGRLPAPIIPDEIPQEPETLAALEKRVDEHPLASGRLVSKPDGGSRLALFIVGLSRGDVAKRGMPAIVRELRAIVGETAAASDLRLGLAGIPAMRTEVIESTRRDLPVFTAVGFLVGALICGFFFRRPRLVLIANAPALFAIFWCLGLFGWTGTPINPLTNAVMPLVLVVTFNDAMHFLFAVCRKLDAGVPKTAAIHQAISEIGPACALTSITTATALFSLAFSSSVLIRSFGLMAGLCVLIALGLVIVVMPLLAAFFLNEAGPKYLGGGRASRGVATLDKAAAALSTWVTRWPKPIALAGVVLTGFFGLVYLQLEPRYRLSDMLPDQGTAADVAHRIEDRLGGLFPLSVMVEWPQAIEPQSTAARKVVQEIHDVLERHPAISKVNSLYDLQLWAESGGLSPDKASARLMETVPPVITSRFVNVERHSALVSGYIGNLEAKKIIRISSEIEPELDAVRGRHPGFTMTLTGLASVGATRSTSIISQLSVSMLGAVAVVIAMMGLAFRSFYIAGLSTIPNLFALFATGTWLTFVHGGLDYATIVGLTVAFGLAVDDTIHVLNRFELEMQQSVSTAMAVDRTLRLIGTVLMLTTVVLLAGLSVTQLSAVPPTRQFGVICMSTLIFALLADIVILPALILVSSRLRARSFSSSDTNSNVAVVANLGSDGQSGRQE